MTNHDREVLHSSQSLEWSTPQKFFDTWNETFHFDLDVCATPENAKCKRYFTKGDDGLKQEWTGTCWCNPPYGREIGLWMRKALESAQLGATVVCLVPARTDTQWWHEYAATADEIRFVRGRLKFGDSKHAAPFPSAVVVFRPASVATNVPPAYAGLRQQAYWSPSQNRQSATNLELLFQ